MKKFIPKVIAAHDISGIGTASLRAAIPILSSMGCYVCPLPTVVLSTITGVFDGFQITDLTDQMEKTIKHWDTLGIEFDYIYSGYLGSHRQVDLIIEAEKRFNSYLVVDPVFADNGELYSTMNDEMVQNMRRLVSKANIITPNFTEAKFLLNKFPDSVNINVYKDMLEWLCDMGPERAVITSAEMENGMYVCAYDRVKDEHIEFKCNYVNVSFHGTGDVFTSVMLGAISRGDGFYDAIKLAGDFVTEAIKITVENNIPLREGIAIEKLLHKLKGEQE